jgi:hypothetical protein
MHCFKGIQCLAKEQISIEKQPTLCLPFWRDERIERRQMSEDDLWPGTKSKLL